MRRKVKAVRKVGGWGGGGGAQGIREGGEGAGANNHRWGWWRKRGGRGDMSGKR